MSDRVKYKIEEYVGRRFGWRVVLCEARAPARNRAALWTVRCDCGQKNDVQAYSLIAGQLLSCRACADTLQGRQNSKMWKGFGAVSLTNYNVMRALADRRKIPWCLSIEEIDGLYRAQGGICALSGRRLEFHRGAGNRRRGNASLDRIDSAGAYIIGNVQLVTKEVNIAKSVLSTSEFVSMCRDIVEHAQC